SPGPMVDHRFQMIGHGAGEVGDQTAAGDVGGGVDGSGRDGGQNRRGVDYGGAKKDFGHGGILFREGAVEVVISEDSPDQREAVGTEVRGVEPDDGVTFFHSIGTQFFAPLDHP